MPLPDAPEVQQQDHEPQRRVEALWQTDSFVDENTLSVNMARLRKKLDGAGLAGFIATRVGAGYLVE